MATRAEASRGLHAGVVGNQSPQTGDVEDLFAHAEAFVAALQPRATVGALCPVIHRGDVPMTAGTNPAALKLMGVDEQRRDTSSHLLGGYEADGGQAFITERIARRLDQHPAHVVLIFRWTSVAR